MHRFKIQKISNTKRNKWKSNTIICILINKTSRIWIWTYIYQNFLCVWFPRICWGVNSSDPLLDRTQGIISPPRSLRSMTTFFESSKTLSASSATVRSSLPAIPWHRIRNAPNSFAERLSRSAEASGRDRRSISAGAGGRWGPGKVSSGSWSVFSRNWLKISLAAERVPLPVGIGDGSGTGIWLCDRHRVIGIATATTSFRRFYSRWKEKSYRNENQWITDANFKSDCDCNDVVEFVSWNCYCKCRRRGIAVVTTSFLFVLWKWCYEFRSIADEKFQKRLWKWFNVDETTSLEEGEENGDDEGEWGLQWRWWLELEKGAFCESWKIGTRGTLSLVGAVHFAWSVRCFPAMEVYRVSSTFIFYRATCLWGLNKIPFVGFIHNGLSVDVAVGKLNILRLWLV